MPVTPLGDTDYGGILAVDENGDPLSYATRYQVDPGLSARLGTAAGNMLGFPGLYNQPTQEQLYSPAPINWPTRAPGTGIYSGARNAAANAYNAAANAYNAYSPDVIDAYRRFGNQFGDLYSKYFGHMGKPAGLPTVDSSAFGDVGGQGANAPVPSINLSHPGRGSLQIVGGPPGYLNSTGATGGVPWSPSAPSAPSGAPSGPIANAPLPPPRPGGQYPPLPPVRPANLGDGGSSPAATATRPPAASIPPTARAQAPVGTPSVPGPLANPTDPRFTTVQWQVPGAPGGGGRGGPSAPIYTAANFGNLFGGGGSQGAIPPNATAQAPGAAQAPATAVYPWGKSTTPGGPFMPVDITGYKVAGVNAPPTLEDLAAMIRFPAGKRPASLMPYGASGAGY